MILFDNFLIVAYNFNWYILFVTKQVYPGKVNFVDN